MATTHSGPFGQGVRSSRRPGSGDVPGSSSRSSVPVSSLLTRLDDATFFNPMYGMHGIDDNPKLVPFANTAKFGQTCTANADCGGPGNLCVSSGGSKKCTAACTGADACGTGFTCRAVASSSTSTIYGRACAKL